MTLNPSLGAGLEGCSEAELVRESAANPPGAGGGRGERRSLLPRGVPLHRATSASTIDRPQFTRTPTSCETSQLISTLTGAGGRLEDPSDDSTATLTEHFQLLNCLDLDFRPHLGLRLRGGVRRGAYPSLRAVFRARPGDASLKRIAVTVPDLVASLRAGEVRMRCSPSLAPPSASPAARS